ncbi:NAD-dependent epimerase/dehydratase family protein [Paenibacillus tianjinensis]|uniref:NAD-dependent epimerase/dehydratase family protein n=1 Tax=Paenibacillus tianjinensis TaxID=2810347 RepID=A0ABX7LBD9_9BACL|nr:NAD-dependent epimerase/dehydratase family protein [Paenibacillus tianjinensis]QSF44666.1 NAD-dependent epimerase/dehydratase family protein [Paenibacillus tianjinensis]
MKVLVTGATGFVGSNLVRGILDHTDYEVSITARKNSDFRRIEDVLGQVTVYYEDLREPKEVANLIQSAKPDIIYHVATYGGFPSQVDKELTIATNLTATINLIDEAAKNNVKQFINTGSSSEYGIKDQPMRETDLCEPVNLYGITKLAATNYCKMVSQTTEMKICTLRLFSPYGKYEDSTRLFPSIISALENNESAKLSRPSSVRDFLPIEDVIDIYLSLIKLNYNSGEIINVGSGKQQTIEEFYWYLAEKSGKAHIQPTWSAAPPRLHEPKVWEADITRLKEVMRGNL